MTKTLKYHFYLRDKKSTIPTPIFFVFNKGGFRAKKGIGESILPQWWDDKSECAIEDSRQTKNEKSLAKRVNKNLKRFREELDELFEDYNSADKLTPNHTDGDDILYELQKKSFEIIDGSLKKEKEETEKSRITPTEFFNQFIDRWQRVANPRTNRVPQKGTIWNYKNTIRRYTDFIRENNLRDSFRLFDSDFIDDFDSFLQEEQELCRNTLNSTHSQLKTLLKNAAKKGYLKDLSFTDWPSKPAPLQHVYLTDDEIKRIMNLVITQEDKKSNKIGPQSKIEESKDLFIISCRTGLRYSDLRHLNNETWNIPDRMLTTTIAKTKQKINIPLHDEVIYIYNKYNGQLPTVVDKSHFNEHIRLCAKLAKINDIISIYQWDKSNLVITTRQKHELISSHTGRRSFATNLYLHCKSAQYVMAITGHTTEENFRRYICVDQKEIAELVKEYINLNKIEFKPNAELIKQVQEDAVTLQKDKEQIQQLEKSFQSERQSAVIEGLDAQLQRRLIAKIIEAWKFGLSYEEYNSIQTHPDEQQIPPELLYN